MSAISLYEPVAGGTTETRLIEIGRPFIHAVTFSLFSAAALTVPIQVEITSQGNSVAPLPSGNAENTIYITTLAAPLRVELKKDVNGPPYVLELRIINGNAGIVSLGAVFEVYNTPYPQTRLYISPGREGDNIFAPYINAVAAERERLTKAEKEKAKKGKSDNG